MSLKSFSYIVLLLFIVLQTELNSREYTQLIFYFVLRVERSRCRLKGTGEYNKFYEEGVYNCARCGTPIYKSSIKFDSGCGWPTFFEGFPGAINRSPNPDGRRTVITCATCGGHLGHVFKGEEFKVPTDERHCVNSVSVKFIPGNATSSI
ncbi:methionine sulfoxide reductase B [Medicago truncatula]|uniref:Methionine sulfoxide reductase B n=2 Tax=Medicago truncatula TaxID=3880 RepID=G7IFN8_MEDTR|nr:methionine sulfoxide reductase B [Medicago truncatula]